MRIKQET